MDLKNSILSEGLASYSARGSPCIGHRPCAPSSSSSPPASRGSSKRAASARTRCPSAAGRRGRRRHCCRPSPRFIDRDRVGDEARVLGEHVLRHAAVALLRASAVSRETSTWSSFTNQPARFASSIRCARRSTLAPVPSITRRRNRCFWCSRLKFFLDTLVGPPVGASRSVYCRWVVWVVFRVVNDLRIQVEQQRRRPRAVPPSSRLSEPGRPAMKTAMCLRTRRAAQAEPCRQAPGEARHRGVVTVLSWRTHTHESLHTPGCAQHISGVKSTHRGRVELVFSSAETTITTTSTVAPRSDAAYHTSRSALHSPKEQIEPTPIPKRATKDTAPPVPACACVWLSFDCRQGWPPGQPPAPTPGRRGGCFPRLLPLLTRLLNPTYSVRARAEVDHTPSCERARPRRRRRRRR